MTIKLNNPKIEQFFIHEFKSDIEVFSKFVLKSLEQRYQLSFEEIAKVVKTSQQIEGYAPVSKEFELEVEAFMMRHNLEVSA